MATPNATRIFRLNQGAGSSFVSSSWTPGATSGNTWHALVANRVTSGTPNTPTLSGNSATWTQIATITFSTFDRITIFASVDASSIGSTTASFGGQSQAGSHFGMWEWVGADNSSVAAMIPQSNTISTGSGTSLADTLAAFA